MSDEEKAGITIGVIFAIVIGAVICFGIDHSWREELVNRGYAEYNSKTSKWQWKNQE